MIGVALRTTMDVDTTIRNFELSEEETLRIVKEICTIEMEDNVSFIVKDVSKIMDAMEYPGICIGLDAVIDEMVTPIKLDVSTGDIITPQAIKYDYKLMLEDRSIKLWSYHLETILAEKLQTILARGTLNTRMRDYYDIYVLTITYTDEIDGITLKKAFEATCKKRNTEDLLESAEQITSRLAGDTEMVNLWSRYQKKYPYAEGILYESIIEIIQKLNCLVKRLS